MRARDGTTFGRGSAKGYTALGNGIVVGPDEPASVRPNQPSVNEDGERPRRKLDGW